MASSQKSNTNSHLRWLKITGDYTLSELQAGGIPAIGDGVLVADVSIIAMTTHKEHESETAIVRITNNGSVELTVGGVASGHFTISSNALIASGAYHDFTVTSPAGTSIAIYNEIVTFKGIHLSSNEISIPTSVEVISSIYLITSPDTPIVVPNHTYDTSSEETGIRVNNDGETEVTVTAESSGHFTTSADVVIAAGGQGLFDFTSPAIADPEEELTVNETITFSALPGNASPIETPISVIIEGDVHDARMTAAVPSGITTITTNRFKVDAGSYIDLPAGWSDWYNNQTIRFEFTGRDNGSFPGSSITMSIFNLSGGAAIAQVTSDAYPLFFETLLVDFSTSPANWNGGSIRFQLDYDSGV